MDVERITKTHLFENVYSYQKWVKKEGRFIDVVTVNILDTKEVLVTYKKAEIVD